MASGLYVPYKVTVMTTGLNLATSDIRVILIDTADYTVDLTNHNFLDDVAAGARVATSNALDNKTTTAGVFDADDETWTSVTGDPCEAIVGYEHSGTESTSDLIWYMDGLSITPNGGNITAAWATSSPKIFAF